MPAHRELWQTGFSEIFDGEDLEGDIKGVNIYIYVANVLNTMLAVIHCTANNPRGRRDRDRVVVGFYNYLCNRYLVPLML